MCIILLGNPAFMNWQVFPSWDLIPDDFFLL